MCERSFLINGHTLNLVLIERLFSVEFHFGDHLYHPQRSWGKVICSEVCIKNSVHGGGLQAHTQGGGWGVWPEPGLQAHIQGEVEGSGHGGSPGPHPGGRLRGLARGRSPGPHPGGSWGVWPWGVSRPTPRGEVEGSPGPCPGGRLRGLAGGVSRSTARGGPGPGLGGLYPSMHWSRYSADGYCCRQYASYWNAFLFHVQRDLKFLIPSPDHWKRRLAEQPNRYWVWWLRWTIQIASWVIRKVADILKSKKFYFISWI